MKFTKEHYELVKSRIEEFVNTKLTDKNVEFYNTKSKTRFRWDLFWASKVKIGDGVGTHGDIIGDYNDDHIDTVLKKIVKELNLDHIGVDDKS